MGTSVSMNMEWAPTVDELLTAPLDDVQRLGALPEGSDDDPLQLMNEQHSPLARLARVLEVLVPMIDSFRTPPRANAWCKRFTGEALERDVTYLQACRKLEGTAANARELAAEVKRMHQALLGERQRLRDQSAWLDKIVTAGRTALLGMHASRRAAPAFASRPDYWARFSRRVDNLHTVHASMLLGIEQFGLSDAQCQSVLDRYHEAMTVLLPLWRQRTGLELFARQYAQTVDERT